MVRGVARGGKRGNCPPPPELFSVTTSLQTNILILQRKSTNIANKTQSLRPLFAKKTRYNERFSCKNPKNPWRLGTLLPHPRLGHPLCRILGAPLKKPIKFCVPQNFGLATLLPVVHPRFDKRIGQNR